MVDFTNDLMRDLTNGEFLIIQKGYLGGVTSFVKKTDIFTHFPISFYVFFFNNMSEVLRYSYYCIYFTIVTTVKKYENKIKD
jgi:hypothetical protein